MLINFIFTVFFLLIGGWALFRIQVRNDYRKKGKLSPISALLELLYFALHANSMYLFIPVKWPNLPPLAKDALLYYPSFFLIILGLVIVLIAMIPLGFNRTMGLDSENLKTNGLYKFTRNPQLIGYYLLLIGFAISYPSFYSAIWIITFGVVAHLMVLTEEEYLLKLYGEQYQDYCKQIPRYLNLKIFR